MSNYTPAPSGGMSHDDSTSHPTPSSTGMAMNGAHPYQESTMGYPMQQASFQMPSSNEAALSLAAQAMSMFPNAQLPGFDMQQMQQMQNGFPGPLASPGLLPNNLFPPLPFPGMPFPHPMWASAFQGFQNMASFQPTVTQQQPFMTPTASEQPLAHHSQGTGDNGLAMRVSDREEGELSDGEMKSPTNNTQVPSGPSGREERAPPRGPRAQQRRSINGHAASADRSNQTSSSARNNDHARAKKVPQQPPTQPRKSVPSRPQSFSSKPQSLAARSSMAANGTRSNGNAPRTGKGDDRPLSSGRGDRKSRSTATSKTGPQEVRDNRPVPPASESARKVMAHSKLTEQRQASPSSAKQGSAASDMPSSARDRAKRAILDLIPYHVNFEQFVAEGVQTETLANLFRELGLEVPSTLDRQNSSAVGQLKVASALPANDTDVGKVSPKPATRVDPHIGPGVNGTASTSKPALTVQTSVGASALRPTGPGNNSAPAKIRPSDTPTASISTPVTAAVTRSTGGLLSAAASKAPSGPGQLERKDLIMQKLAAQRKLAEASKANIQKVTEKTAEPAKPAATEPAPTAPSALKPLESPGASTGKQSSSLSSTSRPPAKEVTAKAPDKPEPLPTEAAQTPDRGRSPAASKQVVPAAIGAGLPPKPPKPIPEVPESLRHMLSSRNTLPPRPSDQQSSQEKKHESEKISVPASMPLESSMVAPTLPSREMTRPSSAQSSSAEVFPRLLTRKRPVAADFDDEPSSSTTPFRRPFGSRGREESVVIHVSEDEDSADEANTEGMVMANGNSRTGATPQPQSAPAAQKKLSIRDMPPLPDFPGKGRGLKDSTSRVLSPATPAGSAPPGKITPAALEKLRQKELEIRRMQQMIAEREQRKASQCKSGAQTPASIPLRAKATTPPEAAQPMPASTVDRLIYDASQQVEEERKRLATMQAAEKDMKRKRDIDDKAEQRKRRRMEIESAFSQTQAEVEQERQRLEEIKAEQEKREALVQQALLRKQQLEEELLKMDVDVDDPPISPRSAIHAVEASPSPLEEQRSAGKFSWRHSTTEHMSSHQAAASVVFDSEIDLLTCLVIEEVAVALQGVAGASSRQPSADPQQGGSEQPAPQPNGEASNVPSREDPGPLLLAADEPDIKMQETPSPAERSPTPSAPFKASPDLSPEQAHSPSEARSTSSAKHDDDDSSSQASSTASVREQGTRASPSEGSASSNSPAHGILDAEVAAAAHVDQTAATSASSLATDRHDSPQLPTETAADLPAGASNSAIQEDTEMTDGDSPDDSDFYEPPEDVPQLDLQQEQPVIHPSPSQADTDQSPPFSPAPVTSKSGSPRPMSGVTSPAPASGADHANDLPVVVSPAGGHEEVTHQPQKPRGFYTPYQSPLRYFHSYRYHPRYFESVLQGFRSLTYSNKIDTDNPLCEFEARGGICNDDSCEAQHFREMKLSGAFRALATEREADRLLCRLFLSPDLPFAIDEHILLQMGSVNEGRDAEEERQYMTGLSQALQELRNRKVKDFETVAAKIVAYRAQFLKDDSRVLTRTTASQPSNIS
ncbi:MAG: hypothetical protein M1823_005272 [Watsoniomyces obsoletus]|nr:MAG: hypothetical protein M1823_005272 [Watsoniomyces obsoletus]